uniref:Ribonuclease P/MRP protein subunit POP5 n=1 Tax=Romanomermis culicivorax TaxID=13658 RepID=A0A915KZA8_ROMCU
MVKFKNRYVLIKVNPDETYFSSSSSESKILEKSDEKEGEKEDAEKISWINTWHIQNTILETLAALHGDYGVGLCKQSFSVKVYNSKTEILILRICAEGSKFLLSALPFVTKLKLKKSESQFTVVPVCLQTLHLGGSLRSCEKSLLKYHRSQIISALKKCKSYGEKESALQIYRQLRAKMKRRYDNYK